MHPGTISGLAPSNYSYHSKNYEKIGELKKMAIRMPKLECPGSAKTDAEGPMPPPIPLLSSMLL
jgi:hypothetical protein